MNMNHIQRLLVGLPQMMGSKSFGAGLMDYQSFLSHCYLLLFSASH